MRVALYARVSTVDRDQNPETQLLPLRRWAEANNHETEEFVDYASSTDFTRRVHWNALQDRLDEFDAIVVLRLDRAFRSTLNTMEYMEKWKQHDIDFISLTENLETQTPIGRFVLTIIAAFAEMEKGMIAQRVKEGMARAKAEGKQIGAKFQTDKYTRFVEALVYLKDDITQAAAMTDTPITTARRWAKKFNKDNRND